MTEQADLSPEATPGNSEGAGPASNGSVDQPAWRQIDPQVWKTMTIEEKIRAIVADVPQEEWDKVPSDLGYQHDHYIYGTPKIP